MIGFDIGGTKCSVCVGQETGGKLTITDKRVIPTNLSVSAYEMINRMCALAEEMSANTDRIGISCGGPLDSKAGVILSPPNLPGWDNIKIVEYLERRYHAAVNLENDANACALAEWKYGAGRGCKNMVFLTFGTGMGAGLILNGQLYSGATNTAGEIGHVRMAEYGPVGFGKSGSFEGFCSGGGIAQIGQSIARKAFQSGNTVSFCGSPAEFVSISAKRIAECAEKGSEDALEVYRICGEMLGRGLSILIDLLNPECIVLGSIFQRSGHLLRQHMQKIIERECIPVAREACRIVPAELGDEIGDYAALAVAVAESRKNVI